MVTLGGFEPPRGQALDLPPLPRLGYSFSGPSGWTRTTTSRVKSPACCVHTTKGNGRRPYQSRMLPLHHISVGANDRIRTDTSRLGRPAGSRYPTFALVRPTGIEPVPPRWRHGMLLHTQAEHGSAVRRSTDILQLSKTPLVSRHTGGQQGIRTQALLIEEGGV